MTRIVLAGNPNCGKTTLFNALTGDNQRVGNWPGVTVEKKSGSFFIAEKSIHLIDLPGIYSLTASSKGASADEKIAVDAVISLAPDLIINVIDACFLERHLYLTSQLLETGKPVIVALTMMDIALERGIAIDIAALSKQLQCAVVVLQAHKKKGIEALQQALQTPFCKTKPLNLQLPEEQRLCLEKAEQYLLSQGHSPEMARYYGWRILEGDAAQGEPLLAADAAFLESDIVLADARYQKIHEIVINVQKKLSDASEHITARIDKIVLHRYWAFPIFFAAMYLMFLFAINIGGAFQDFFDITSDTIFVQGTTWVLQQIHSPTWLIAILAQGVGMGINTTLTFIPVIAALFFFLSLLESSGYMARAAFVVDKVMRALGLPGKAFVPMIVGFGCNVPAIMAARTLDSLHDRKLTIAMSPFMSCSARLAIYAVFVAAFFPAGGQNVVFSLYVIGIVLAVLTGLILRTTILPGKSSPLILELPVYHRPAIKRLCQETLRRLRFFILRAGKMIIPVCVVLGSLNALTLNGSESILSLFGQWLTPIFSPMGLTADNWPATVGLLTGMLAKEVVVGTLNSLYAQAGHLGALADSGFDFLGSLYAAICTIPNNLKGLGQALINPILASAPSGDLSQSVYGLMVERFDGQAGAFAYLLFVLLYIPCVSTMAVIRQEANRGLMWFSIIWSFVAAYAAAVIFYQAARFAEHPQASLTWIALMAVGIMVFIGALKCLDNRPFNQTAAG